MLIKVCGLRDADNIQAIDNLGIDFIGLIFYPASSRFVGNADIPSTRSAKVGVFVNQSLDEIMAAAKRYQLSYIQLHGNESLSMLQALCDKGFKLIKAFSVSNELDMERLAAYAPFCDYILLDTKGKQAGGNGVKFDWRLLNQYVIDTPFLLSGGIAPHDAPLIKSIQQPLCAGIDLNSQFEISPALKDLTQLNQFIYALR